MNIVFCDKCKKEATPYSKVVVSARRESIHHPPQPIQNQVDVDLCDNCRAELLEFLNV